MGAALLITALFARTSLGDPHVPPIAVTNAWVTTSCWDEVRWFDSLRTGPIDYCRKHLRFSPGAVDCVTYADEVCSATNTITGESTQLRTPGGETVFACPRGPEPPVCPRFR